MAYKAIINLEIRAAKLEKFYADFSRLSKGLSRDIVKLNRQMEMTFGERMRERMSKFGKGMRRMSGQARTMGIVAAVGLASVVRVAASFEEQMFRAKFVLGATNKEFKELSKNARNIAKESIFTPTEIATTTKLLAKQGRTVGEINNQLRDFVLFSQFTETPLVETAGAMSKAFKALGKGITPEKFLNTMAIVMNKTSLSADSLFNALTFAGSTFKGMKAPLVEQIALVGALSDSMIIGSKAGTGIRSFAQSLGTLTKPAKKIIEEYAKVAGVKFSDFVTKGAVTDLELFFEVISKGAKQSVNQVSDMDKVFGKIGGNVVAALTTGGLDEFGETLARVRKEMLSGKVVYKDFAKGFDELSSKKLKNFISALSELAVKLGESGVLDTLNFMLDKFKVLFDAFERLSPSAKVLATSFGMLVAGLLVLAPSIIGVISLFSLMGVTWAGLTAGLGLAAVPLVLLIGLAAELTRTFNGQPSIINSIINLFKHGFGAVADLFSGRFMDALRGVLDILVDIGDILSGGILGVAIDTINAHMGRSAAEAVFNGDEEGYDRRVQAFRGATNALNEQHQAGTITLEEKRAKDSKLVVYFQNDGSPEQFAAVVTAGSTTTASMDRGVQ